ncbi:MAG: hypothetical protein KDA32_08830 [Phycisphaerales bacterium]|nr:hypothetical protein [Phycisphaerales bacterium]
MKRLWDKGAGIDEVVHHFTVGDDPILDRELLYWDCIGSAAHARGLVTAGLLDEKQCGDLLAALHDLAELAQRGELTIPPELEDGHTLIESELEKRIGEAGRRIHAGRSRNDQIATAMRLWMRSATLEMLDALSTFMTALRGRIADDGDTPVPGFTHMQPAMPSSVGQWLHALFEAGLEQMRAGLDLLSRLDSCPLGTGAGFGVSLNLDRAHTAELLGFSGPQRSPIDVQNSRGRKERYFVRVAVDVGALIEKLACDCMLLFSPPLALIGLPDEFTTGSSIMPQKRNPDVLELMRARGAAMRSLETELNWVTAKLPSSYHRDLQLTKRPTLRAANEALGLLDVATRVVLAFTLNHDRLRDAMIPELYATEAAFELVRGGTPFRDAYREVAARIKAGALKAPARAEAGLADPDALNEALSEFEALALRTHEVRDRVRQAEFAIFSPD